MRRITQRIGSIFVMLTILAAVAVTPVSQAAPLKASNCSLPGCIVREAGNNAQWWADSWTKGTCRDHPRGSQDWIVTYKVNNNQWKRADQSKVRFYAAGWSKASWSWNWKSSQVQVENDSLPSGDGITICLSGSVFNSNDIKGTYLWRKP